MNKESTILILESLFASIRQNSSVIVGGNEPIPEERFATNCESLLCTIPFPSASPLIIGHVSAETIVVNRTNNNKLNTNTSNFFPLISPITSNHYSTTKPQ